MMQTVIVREPPLIEEIDAAFHVRGKPIFYSFGHLIFNPAGVLIPPSLMAHEGVHGDRQTDPEAWWRRYIADPEFRLDEEIPAHIAEYQFFADKPRNERRFHLTHIAKRLCSPLYGSLITPEKAKRILKEGAAA